jgi:hypothetical protein
MTVPGVSRTQAAQKLTQRKGNHYMMKLAKLALLAALVAGPAWAQTEPATAPESDPAAQRVQAMAEMNALQDQVREGKRGLVEQQMQLSEAEAAKFWPIYDAQQEALAGFNKRRLDNILAYATAWNAGPIDDATAGSIAKTQLSIEKDEVAQMQRIYDKSKKAVGASKALRYLQIEGKIRALVRFEQAAEVPLAQ